MPHPAAILSLILLSAVALPSAASAAEPACHANDRYKVAIETYEEDAGSRFAITTHDGGSAPASCVFDASKADFVIGDRGDPLWFQSLSGRLLILTRSTGPQGDLLVYDLESRKPVLEVPADEFEVVNGSLSYWQRIGQAVAENCPSFAENQANGMGSVTAVRKLFDLGSLAISETGESKCVAVQ